MSRNPAAAPRGPFPRGENLDTFDFTAAGVSATQIHTLARGEWVTAPENLIFAGPIGTGKTHLAIALGGSHQAETPGALHPRGRPGAPAAEARDTRELTRSAAIAPRRRAHRQRARHRAFDPRAASCSSICSPTAMSAAPDGHHQPHLADWVTVFAGDEKLTTALLDRLAHHAAVLTTKGKSYRMRKRRTRQEPS